jgi:outer membrane receptor for ferrienterochelin and colicin
VELQGFQKIEADDVLVLLGRTVEFPASLKVGSVSEVVNVTGEAAKQVDLKSVTIQHNVTQEEFDRMPKARSFTGIALTAPSVNQGTLEGGLQVNGASGAENMFTVDGVATNSLINGSSRQDTVFEYLQEVQVKTGGIDAEYGGALGGVISAVTKSGGNVFHGEGHYYFFGSPLSAGPVQRLVLSPVDDISVSYVTDDKQRDNRNEFGGSVGGPLVKDRLFFFGSYSPRLVRRTNDYGYANGADPGSTDQDQNVTQAFGKLSYSQNRVQANGSILFTPTTSTGTLIAYSGTTPNSSTQTKLGNAPNTDRGFKSDQTNFSGNVDFWLTSASFVSVRGGYFYDNYNDTGIPNTTSVTWNRSSIGLAGVPASLQQGVNFSNTPRAQITNFDKTKTGFVQLDYNHSFNAGGSHLLKGGYGYRKVENDVESLYPGGYVLLNWDAAFRSSVTGQTARGTYGYYEVDDFGTTGKAGANINSLYVQDTWTVGSRLTLNLGVRTEHEVIPSFREGIDAFSFTFGQKLAPRLGASYDLRGDGRVKLYGSWGRYYDWTKYDLVRGSYGGDIWHIYYRSLDTLDVLNLNLSNKPGADLWNPAVANSFRDRRVPNFDSTDPNIKPMYQDSFNGGVEYQLSNNQMFGVHYVHNNLGRTIEDLGGLVNGDEVYVIGNPGEGIGALTPPSGRTAPFATPKPKRQYDALELTYNRRFSQNWFGSANLTISRLYGNYAGLASSDEIRTPTTGVSSPASQQQAGNVFRQGGNANRAWDIDELLWDSHGNLDVLGRLATDRPVVAKFYGSYTLPFGTQLGGFVYAGSGTPISTYVVTLNQTQVFVNGRGDMGRTPFLSRADLLVSHEFSVGGSKKVRAELNVQNLFNQKTATHIFNFLNRGSGLARASAAADLSGVNLANGYDYNALILQSAEGAGAYDPRYGKEDLFQTGLQGQFSVKFIF